jgi:hypothetical protein
MPSAGRFPAECPLLCPWLPYPPSHPDDLLVKPYFLHSACTTARSWLDRPRGNVYSANKHAAHVFATAAAAEVGVCWQASLGHCCSLIESFDAFYGMFLLSPVSPER